MIHRILGFVLVGGGVVCRRPQCIGRTLNIDRILKPWEVGSKTCTKCKRELRVAA